MLSNVVRSNVVSAERVVKIYGRDKSQQNPEVQAQSKWTFDCVEIKSNLNKPDRWSLGETD